MVTVVTMSKWFMTVILFLFNGWFQKFTFRSKKHNLRFLSFLIHLKQRSCKLAPTTTPICRTPALSRLLYIPAKQTNKQQITDTSSPWAPRRWWAVRTCRTGRRGPPGSCSRDTSPPQSGRPGSAGSSHSAAAPPCPPPGNRACGGARRYPGLSCRDQCMGCVINMWCKADLASLNLLALYIRSCMDLLHHLWGSSLC